MRNYTLQLLDASCRRRFRRLVKTKAVENEKLETEQQHLRKKTDYEALFEKGDKSAQVENLKLKDQLAQVSSDNRKFK